MNLGKVLGAQYLVYGTVNEWDPNRGGRHMGSGSALNGLTSKLFKGGINLFYPSAHRTLNHDRRIPGGVMISTNSPGHYATSLVTRGVFDSFEEAVDEVRDIARRSIGNGGYGGGSRWPGSGPREW